MKQPKIFELSWGWYEENSSVLFTHPDKTDEQFAEDVKSLYKKYGDEYLASIPELWAGVSGWSELVSEKMSELGYERVRPTVYVVWGSDIIGVGDEQLKATIGEELFNKAKEHNDIVRAMD